MPIPLKMRAEMSRDPFYKACALRGWHEHTCEGKITWEHALIHAGKKVQLPFAIVPLCEKAHAVNFFQDAGTMRKELNVWVALNRATDDELKALSKAVDYLHMRSYLNSRYGVWESLKAVDNPVDSLYSTGGQRLTAWGYQRA